MVKEERKVRNERMRTKKWNERKKRQERDKGRRSPTPGQNTAPSSA